MYVSKGIRFVAEILFLFRRFLSLVRVGTTAVVPTAKAIISDSSDLGFSRLLYLLKDIEPELPERSCFYGNKYQCKLLDLY